MDHSLCLLIEESLQRRATLFRRADILRILSIDGNNLIPVRCPVRIVETDRHGEEVGNLPWLKRLQRLHRVEEVRIRHVNEEMWIFSFAIIAYFIIYSNIWQTSSVRCWHAIRSTAVLWKYYFRYAHVLRRASFVVRRMEPPMGFSAYARVRGGFGGQGTHDTWNGAADRI